MIKKIIVLLCCLPAVVSAQQPGWHLLDLEKDSVYGIGITRAYQELLRHKTPDTVIVAILDAGIDTLHEDLNAVLWRNPGERPGGEDHDRNGYRGDLFGWNFIGGPAGQLTKESKEYPRVYYQYKDRFEHLSGENQVKRRDRELYRQWLRSKELMKPADSVPPPVYRDSVVQDDYRDLKDRYYGNADLTGDPYFHGTHVAGIVGAVRDNGIGMDGIADAVKLMGIRVVPNGDEHDKDVALGIRYAVDNGAHIINMSFGKPVSPERKWVEDAIRYANKKGVLIVAAAGNDRTDVDKKPHYPTPFYIKGKGRKRAPNMISVGASGPVEKLLVAPFSNYGKNTVDVFAPGMFIYSTMPDNGYRSLQGTSMAAPVVSGIAAVLKSYYPHLKAKEIKAIIEASVQKVESPVTVPGNTGRAPLSEISRTGGIVNAYEAVKLAEQR